MDRRSRIVLPYKLPNRAQAFTKVFTVFPVFLLLLRTDVGAGFCGPWLAGRVWTFIMLFVQVTKSLGG